MPCCATCTSTGHAHQWATEVCSALEDPCLAKMASVKVNEIGLHDSLLPQRQGANLVQRKRSAARGHATVHELLKSITYEPSMPWSAVRRRIINICNLLSADAVGMGVPSVAGERRHTRLHCVMQSSLGWTRVRPAAVDKHAPGHAH
jgi:hypothetical protein